MQKGRWWRSPAILEDWDKETFTIATSIVYWLILTVGCLKIGWYQLGIEWFAIAWLLFAATIFAILQLTYNEPGPRHTEATIVYAVISLVIGPVIVTIAVFMFAGYLIKQYNRRRNQRQSQVVSQ